MPCSFIKSSLSFFRKCSGFSTSGTCASVTLGVPSAAVSIMTVASPSTRLGFWTKICVIRTQISTRTACDVNKQVVYFLCFHSKAVSLKNKTEGFHATTRSGSRNQCLIFKQKRSYAPDRKFLGDFVDTDAIWKALRSARSCSELLPYESIEQ